MRCVSHRDGRLALTMKKQYWTYWTSNRGYGDSITERSNSKAKQKVNDSFSTPLTPKEVLRRAIMIGYL
jgi:hypothetical protein